MLQHVAQLAGAVQALRVENAVRGELGGGRKGGGGGGRGA